MATSRAVTAPDAGVWRIARGPNPFTFRAPPPPLPSTDQPVHDGNRWDDPKGEFATLYCATTAEGAFVETIAYFRTRPGLLERIDQFLTGNADPSLDSPLDPGRVPDEYFTDRVLGHTTVSPSTRFVDVEHPHTHAAATVALEPLLTQHRITTVDLGVMYHQDRRITRPMGRHYWQLAQSADHHDWAGLRYMSRLGPDWECWAMWEPSPLNPESVTATPVRRDHPDLLAAARALDIAV